MDKMIRFRLNETDCSIPLREESLALDWIRDVAGLKGTKEGCREGDCGACLVMMGGPGAAGGMEWLAVTSCTLAVGDLDGRHVITIEGLASLGLTPVMEAMLDEGASQCGFCSPGFVLALTSFLVAGTTIDPVSAMVAVEGNLCRCTGYGSIRRAASRLASEFSGMPASLPERLDFLAARKVLPPRLASLMKASPIPATPEKSSDPTRSVNYFIGGGTDYFVRNPDPDPALSPLYADREPGSRLIRKIQVDGADCIEIGCGVTASDFFSSPLIREKAPGIERFSELVASLPIRNRATLAGNVANASPIADMTAMLMALGALLVVGDGAENTAGDSVARSRVVPLDKFFIAYKKVDLVPGERIISLRLPAVPVRFSFEKVAKRARLDIASVNTAMAVTVAGDGTIARARFSAGGIAATPLCIRAVEELIEGKAPRASLARAAGKLARDSGTPLSDVRGSAEYRKRLMERLTWAHFMRLWPELRMEEELLS